MRSFAKQASQVQQLLAEQIKQMQVCLSLQMGVWENIFINFIILTEKFLWDFYSKFVGRKVFIFLSSSLGMTFRFPYFELALFKVKTTNSVSVCMCMHMRVVALF